MHQRVRWGIVVAASVALLAAPVLTTAQNAPSNNAGGGTPTPPGFTAKVIASGGSLTHTYTAAGAGATTTEPLTQPDDITSMGGHLFVAFQNGVGPQGQPSKSGNPESTIVELTFGGQAVSQWDVAGHCDGLTADPANHRLIATVNEDAKSSLYTIDPQASGKDQLQHYTYSEALPHNGGTDAISIVGGQILISASSPGTSGPSAPNVAYPAVYAVKLDAASGVATVSPLFSDEAHATQANVTSPNYGTPVQLALTDPDSNEVVPAASPRFAGDFVLDSQGDEQQVYVRDPGGSQQSLSVLNLSQSINDTAWVTDTNGTLYVTDHTHNTVDAVEGGFVPGLVLAAVTPCGANSSPSICPGSGYPDNYLGALDLYTGAVRAIPVQGVPLAPEGLLYMPASPTGTGH